MNRDMPQDVNRTAKLLSIIHGEDAIYLYPPAEETDNWIVGVDTETATIEVESRVSPRGQVVEYDI